MEHEYKWDEGTFFDVICGNSHEKMIVMELRSLFKDLSDGRMGADRIRSDIERLSSQLGPSAPGQRVQNLCRRALESIDKLAEEHAEVDREPSGPAEHYYTLPLWCGEQRRALFYGITESLNIEINRDWWRIETIHREMALLYALLTTVETLSRADSNAEVEPARVAVGNARKAVASGCSILLRSPTGIVRTLRSLDECMAAETLNPAALSPIVEALKGMVGDVAAKLAELENESVNTARSFEEWREKNPDPEIICMEKCFLEELVESIETLSSTVSMGDRQTARVVVENARKAVAVGRSVLVRNSDGISNSLKALDACLAGDTVDPAALSSIAKELKSAIGDAAAKFPQSDDGGGDAGRRTEKDPDSVHPRADALCAAIAAIQGENAYKEDMRLCLIELQKGFASRCYISVMCLCGKILEGALKLRLLKGLAAEARIGLSKKLDGMELGGLLGWVEKRDPTHEQYLPIALKNFANVIREYRNSCAHSKGTAAVPSMEESLSVVFAIFDFLKRTIDYVAPVGTVASEPVTSGDVD